MRAVPGALIVLTCVVGVPGPAFAQAIGGSVKDEQGTMLAGVTVEASSPALIEKIRTAVTNESGQYRIEGLRSGTYTVTFALAGFRPYVRHGIELTGSFTAIVNAELTVGLPTETITVTGEIPVVDVHSASHEMTLSTDIVKSIPTVRSYNALLVLVPGVVINANDTVTGTATTSFPIYGGRTTEGRLLVDGLSIGSPPSGNSPTNYVVDAGHAQEITFLTASALGEVETAGVVMNIVPKSGGNMVRGSIFASGTGEKLQFDNLTPALTNQGVPMATPLTKVYDFSGAIGGPIMKDRLWYFIEAHTGGSTREIANVYYNLNAGDPTRWLYAPDLARREYSDRTFENASLRVTWQLTPRNKIGGFWDGQTLCRNCTGATSGLQEPARVSPEAAGILGRPLRVSQATWSSRLTNGLLVEAGYGGTFFGVGNVERKPNPTRDLIRVAEQCASGCAANGNIPGLVYRSQDFVTAYTGSYLGKGSLSYVTADHTLKIGYQQTLMTDDRTWMTNSQNLSYRFDNGVPNQLTQSISPWINNARAAWQAVFAQHRWTAGRLTLQSAVRFDRARSWFPEQRIGPSKFLPTPISIPETPGVNSYKDITPRMGMVYDVSGAGKTALKMTLGKFLESAGVIGNYANTNPTLRMPQTTSVFGTAGVTRAWTDANRNFVPDCDLLNPFAQDLRTTGGDQCGMLSDTNFGKDVLINNFDPGILSGWGVRPSDWNLSVSVQHQIVPRASLEVAYHRRWYRGFFVADNVMLQPSDLTPFTVVAPSDPRLPGGGGYRIDNLYDVVPEKFGQVSNFVADSSKYGDWYQYFSGVDVIASVRTNNFTFFGGTSTGQTVADNCDVRARLPELATTTTGTSAFGAGLMGSAVTPINPDCHVAYGILTQFRGLASYFVPAAEVHFSATFQSKPGAMLVANWAVPNSVAATSLQRNLAGNASNVTVNLVPPGTMYGDRINQLDLRVAKILRFGSTRTMIAVDIYNSLNASAALTYNTSFVPSGIWPQPNAIQTPRFIRLTAEFDF